MTTHKFTSQEDLMKLIKNYTLLSLVEAAKYTTPGHGKHKGGLHKSKTLLIGQQA
jgi:hypothetical protein